MEEQSTFENETIDLEEYMYRCIQLEDVIREKEKENAALKNQLAERKQWLDKLQESVMSTKVKKQSTSRESILYKKYKNDKDIREKLRKELDSIGYHDLPIPWQMVKYHTNRL